MKMKKTIMEFAKANKGAIIKTAIATAVVATVGIVIKAISKDECDEYEEVEEELDEVYEDEM
jgi:methylthioribose-1-phosphate isomerase